MDVSNYPLTIIQTYDNGSYLKYELIVSPKITGEELLNLIRDCLIGFSHFDDKIKVYSLGNKESESQSKISINNDNMTQTLIEINQYFGKKFQYSLNGSRLYVHWKAGGINLCCFCIACCCLPCFFICNDAYTTHSYVKSFEMPNECNTVYRGIFIYINR